ncbi:MAG TPA: hypothetical protein VKR61_00050 [Bryobacteraceae bacterium]|nr:hypothetical protein [Bryobacteraceae bacterium]
MLFRNITKAIAIAAAVVAPAIHAATPLILDNFKAGHYQVSLTTAQAQDIHFAPLAAGSPLGPARETVLVVGGNPYGQRSSLDIGKGICIVNGGFGVVPGLQIYYGYANATTPAPLGLDLSAYSAFQLTVAGIATEVVLGVEIAVWTHSGAVYGAQVFLPPTPNVTSVEIPFTSFTGGFLDASDIDTIGIVTWGGGTNSYGITSFEAVP